jgi:FixJ family two-component response regulator
MAGARCFWLKVVVSRNARFLLSGRGPGRLGTFVPSRRVVQTALEFLDHPRVPVPNCLVLDVSLPGLNGLGLQSLIAGERTDMPIIFITAVPEETTRAKALKAGAVGFLSKPFGEEWLINHLDVALKRDKPDCER